MMTDIAERYLPRNRVLLIAAFVSHGVGATFLGFTTILPSIVSQLGGSPLAVGSLGAITLGAPYLPQLLAGRWIANRPRVRRHLLVPATLSRTCLILIPLALTLWARPAPGLALAAVLVSFGAFQLVDSIGSVSYLEIVAKTIPTQQRGRLFGACQSATSLACIAVGMVVERILARANPFPGAYTLLTSLGVLFIFGVIPTLGRVVEPPGAGSSAQPTWAEYLPQLGRIMRQDARFMWLAVGRWLAGTVDMANAFYVVYATERLHLPAQMLGLLISAGVVGSLLSGLLGPLGDRHGARAVIIFSMALRALCPALVLLAPFAAGYVAWAVPVLFVVVFALLGFIAAANMTGFLNYLLEIAPAEQRSSYIGLGNTLSGLAIVAPLAAGGLVQATSYEFLFLATLVIALAGVAYAVRMPRQRVQVADQRVDRQP
jgi:hypothetical protein